MPFLTQINGATIDLGAETPVVTLPPTGVLNSFGESREFEQYNVLDDGSSTTTQPGEYLAPIVGGEPIAGSYQGGVEFSNVGLNLGPVSVTSLIDIRATITVNQITGDYFIDQSGNVFIISEDPLDADNLTVSGSLTTTTAGLPATVSLPDVSLTEFVANNPLLAPNGVNGLLNQVVTTQTPDPDASLVIETDEIGALVCFAAGTDILTPSGYRSVEDLSVGDLVCTKDNGDVPISWIGSRNVTPAVLTAFPNFRPIRISAGALGAGLPSTDLMVSPQHRILIRSKIAQKMFGTNEVLVAAKQLLQIEGIDIAQDVDSVDYFHFMFDKHEVVIANGAETESMFTGPQALKSVSQAARAEIFALFPQLRDRDHAPQGARVLASGRMGRKLVSRHIQHRKVLV
ncbi:Hint domain-containing protein [Paracoccus gahaiensis]|uniref:Hint domain-containing protein n=1 Tax=Paracoccus gahaiensis TaxID=1706839 RepID=A0A4U0R9T3_9RHOB|nr:Hint domain-containing protein [Paracoccus gahaiensis]TJZ91767.1 Hint domain-containing protein [Paracoccus gahaiensis]